jgi:hypothetical protein
VTSTARSDVAVRREANESGAVLILALVFLLVVGGVVGSLANWALNDLNNTKQFTTARTMQYAVSGATETAIQNIRYTPLLGFGQTLNASPPTACWTTGSNPLIASVTVNAQIVDAWCSTVWTPTSAATRVVTISTCLSSVSVTACAAHPALQAVVTFGDYPPGYSAPNSGQCQVYCGTSMTVNSWVWG